MPELFAGRKTITVASGEMFVASNAKRAGLKAETNANAIDMNSFGLLAACAAAKVPHLGWRVISDRADNQASEAFRVFVKTYDGAGGKALAEFVRSLPQDPTAPTNYRALRSLLDGK